MPKGRSIIVLASSMMLFACSKSGKGGTGNPDEYDAVGSGNIPLSEPGKELKDVTFTFDSSDLSTAAQGTMRENSRWLLDNPARKVTVEGHCDERGTEEYNMALGLRRAETAKDFLRSAGVQTGRMATVSYGKELPLDPGHSESAWAKNRRAHFSIQ